MPGAAVAADVTAFCRLAYSAPFPRKLRIFIFELNFSESHLMAVQTQNTWTWVARGCYRSCVSSLVEEEVGILFGYSKIYCKSKGGILLWISLI